MHFVLHFVGLGSVLKFKLCECQYSSMAGYGGCQNPVIVRVFKHSVEVTVDTTSRGSTPEELEEIVDIKAIEYATENCPLSNAIAQTKYVRDDSIPANVCILKHVDDHEHPEEDLGESFIEQLLEQQRMFNRVKYL